MHQSDYLRVAQRFLILVFLSGCLFVLSSPLHVRVLAATCESCDENRYLCLNPCSTQYNACVSSGNYSQDYCNSQYNACYSTCQTAYSSCLTFCTWQDGSSGGGGGGGGTCGQQRGTCGADCAAAKHQCIDEGWGDCGQEYTGCMNACCS